MRASALIPSLVVTAVVAAAAPYATAAAPAARDGESPAVQQARKHFKTGEEAFKAGDFERARHEFEAGYALVPRPGFLLNMAHSERRLGHLRKARALYEKYLEADPDGKQRDEVIGLIKMIDKALAQEEKEKEKPPQAEAVGEPAARPQPPPEPTVVVTPASKEEQAPAAVPSLRPVADDPTPTPAATLAARAPATDEGESSAPLYTRWWFWGAIVVVAAGAAAGIVLATRGSPTFHDDGSLGRLGGP